jgi:hypothetical protein
MEEARLRETAVAMGACPDLTRRAHALVNQFYAWGTQRSPLASPDWLARVEGAVAADPAAAAAALAVVAQSLAPLDPCGAGVLLAVSERAGRTAAAKRRAAEVEEEAGVVRARMLEIVSKLADPARGMRLLFGVDLAAQRGEAPAPPEKK